MVLKHFDTIRLEEVMRNGRTHPMVLRVARVGNSANRETKLVKAIGCPEASATRQLVAEVIGNALARRLGLNTPEPCVVWIGEHACRIVNSGIQNLGYSHSVLPGPAAGCEWIRPAPAPFTAGQNLSPEVRTQAARLYVFDLLTQNPDRRAEKPNCALTKVGLLAYDFEMCFQHLFLPIIGSGETNHWEPSKSGLGSGHLFRQVARSDLPDGLARTMASAITIPWWEQLLNSVPDAWQGETERIGEALFGIARHATEFGQDIRRSLL